MERIDPEQVTLPAWYQPNPQRADDVAFVLFVGEADTTRAVCISNRRCAMSALGTASAAGARAGDTIYSLAPLHHSSTLLVGVAGAIASGARFAVATENDPTTFWAEVRRYGATHISYTWTSLREVAQGPMNPAERHQPIRIFLGSGMSSNLWRRLSERFPGTRVLEFYASAAGAAILANVAGIPVGSVGRPLPDSPQVRLAAFDQQAGSLVFGDDGLVEECTPGEVGLLLAQVDSNTPGASDLLRGVFRPDDAWQSTDDLFRQDEHGDFWLVDPVSALVTTVDGVVAPGHARRAMEAVPASDLVVAYGIPDPKAAETSVEVEVVVVALTVLPDAELTTDEIDRAFTSLPTRQRPRYALAVDDIPVTTWGRPMWTPLRTAGPPRTGQKQAWRLDEVGEHYTPW